MASATRKVCVLDDDEAVRDSMRALLESHGLDVEIYAHAREFLDHVPSSEGSCLLLDLHMPEMNGIEVLGALRRLGSTLPVILITGHADTGLSALALEAGARALLNKPVEERLLMNSIDLVTGEAQQNGHTRRH